MSKKGNYFAGMATGVIIMLVIMVIYFGVQSFIGYTRQVGVNMVASEYEDQDTKLQDILNVMEEFYYEDFDSENMYDEAYKGFVEGVGDRYTVYYSPDEYKDYSEDIDGTYEGIGAYVGYGENEGELIIIAPMDGSPSKAAGIEAFDRILEVDGVDVNGMTTTELVKLIKGPKDTEVVLKVQREDETLDIPIIRAQIEVPTVSHEMLDDDIGYLRISGFDGVTYEQFMEAYSDLEANGQKGMIIDLRYNGGGYTHIVSAIADELLPKGTIYYTEDKNGKQNVIESDEKKRFDKPLVILVNESSASASEILAGSVQDHERGIVVGTQTFGKGLVQRGVELDDGSYVTVTIARYYTPDGNFIHGTGITPDVVAELPDLDEDTEYPDDFDPQLDVAVEEILKLMK